MAGVHAGRWERCVLAALWLLLIAVPRAEAVEALDGRIQAHGFLEMQIRSLSGSFSEELDLAQWYNVINVELEFDILPNGWGPFDLLSAYVRVEGRFDCLYYDACGIFPSARTYGNKSRDLPLRLRDALDEDYAGVIETNDQANPPGSDVYRVPDTGDDARDPTGWTVEKHTTLPRLEPWNVNYKANVDYDPLLDNVESPFNPTPDPPAPLPRSPQYARWQPTPDPIGDPLPRDRFSYCPTNGLTGGHTADGQPIGPYRSLEDGRIEEVGCYTNRPVIFELDKRRGFPGFDTLFDINGADGELGPNPDYWLADPNVSVNDLLALEDELAGMPGEAAAEAGTLAYERALRGLALERDDPAYYTFGVSVDTSLVGADAIGAIDPADFEGDPAALQDLAQQIVYGGDPNDPGYSDEDCANGLCGPIREAGQVYTLDSMLDWKFTFRGKEGPGGGTGTTVVMGPWLPKNFFGSLAAGSDRANPFRGRATPTHLIVLPVGGATPRAEGQRYHILDVASGYFDPTTGCDTGLCTYGPDPVDPRILKYEQLLIAVENYNAGLPAAERIEVGGKNTAAWFGPYPNNFLSNFALGGAYTPSFGGDFSGVVARYNTYTNRATFGALLKNTNFIAQITTAGSSDPYDSQSFKETIAYTNIAVTGGLGELPMRVAPDRSNLSKLDPLKAQGLYVPSRGLVNALATQDFDDHEFNIEKIDRAFNHGASQNDTYELKEAYLDMEFLDSRLWLRAGIQNIVWGKTELFRTTDQFNPQDLAMASLPGLEESRIGLLSARAVYSFYDIGPLEDVRLELAANFDRIKPADLGACGEPYTIDVVCAATFGLAVHSLAGIGLAGVDRPPSAWNDVKGVEFGGRIEFRWDRFSFAITDFYGYNDLPYPDPIFFYERNVDPNTGRMRKAGATGPCENAAGYQADLFGGQPVLQAGNAPREFLGGDASAAPSGEETPSNVSDDYARRRQAYMVLGVGIDPACLKPGGAPGYPNENRYDVSKAPDAADFALYATSSLSAPNPDSYIYQTLGQWSRKGSSEDYALAYHPANQQFFAALCSGTITVAVSLTPGACAFNIFGSPSPLIPIQGGGIEIVPFSEYFAVLTAGEIDQDIQNFFGWRLIIQNTKANRDAIGFIPASPLNRDVRDGMVTATVAWVARGGSPTSPGNFLTLDSTLTSEQKALLGCGPFFGTRCDSGAAYSIGTFKLFGEGGGVDFLNAEASAVLMAFPGLEGTDLSKVTPRWVQIGEDPNDPPENSGRESVWIDTWTTWSDDAQPGTIDFEGGVSCTRYAPDSLYADERGIVRLPGCRGADSATVNPEPNYDVGGTLFPTIDVVFEEHYTPRQDGCIFGRTMTGRDNQVYFVRAVNEDGTVDSDLNAELTQTCWNTNANQVSLNSTHRWTPTFDASNNNTWPYVGQTQSVLGARTLFHPLGGCESAGLDRAVPTRRGSGTGTTAFPVTSAFATSMRTSSRATPRSSAARSPTGRGTC